MSVKRTTIVDTINSWVGLNEADGSYKRIIDIYNSQKPLPAGVKMQYSWPWCACTASAAFVANGYTSKDAPLEISCPRMISLAQACKTGAFRWIEDDATVPELGWFCLYDWDDNGVGDNRGTADHVGIVTYVNKASGYFVVTEGNYSDSVKKRTISINGRYIRGFIAINYSDANNVGMEVIKQREEGKDENTVAHEVISGLWGIGDVRKKALEAAGYSYSAIQSAVNKILNGSAPAPSKASSNAPTEKKVTATCYATNHDPAIAGTYKTTSKLYLRNDAGTNMKALVLMPKDVKVECYGYYNVAAMVKWYYVTVNLDGIQYTGFCSSEYLKKV